MRAFFIDCQLLFLKQSYLYHVVLQVVHSLMLTEQFTPTLDTLPTYSPATCTPLPTGSGRYAVV